VTLGVIMVATAPLGNPAALVRRFGAREVKPPRAVLNCPIAEPTIYREVSHDDQEVRFVRSFQEGFECRPPANVVKLLPELPALIVER